MTQHCSQRVKGKIPNPYFSLEKQHSFKQICINLLLLQVTVLGAGRRVLKETTRVLALGSTVLVEGGKQAPRLTVDETNKDKSQGGNRTVRWEVTRAGQRRTEASKGLSKEVASE